MIKIQILFMLIYLIVKSFHARPGNVAAIFLYQALLTITSSIN